MILIIIQMQYKEMAINLLNKLNLPGDGAFLCKNSILEYTWISYYQTFDSFRVYKAEFKPADIYDNMYYYDSGTVMNEEAEVVAAGAIYKAKKENERIIAVSVTVENDINNIC